MSKHLPPLAADQIPAGFRFSGIACGIKKSKKADLALFVADQPAVAAGVYTQNVVHAASIDWNRSVTPSSQARAVVVNSGNANACTGERGIKDNQRMAELVATELKCNPNDVIVMSTGIIGEFLPMEAIETGIPQAIQAGSSSSESFAKASEAIMTTDVGPKVAAGLVPLDDTHIKIAGVAKGAGMIGPRMATMLSIVVTDAKLSAEQAHAMLSKAADVSFNCISVEGHTSTSDALVLLASGESGKSLESQEELDRFQEELNTVCIALAKQIPSDGEGATHLITIRVHGLKETADAQAIARSIANSALVKTAITGGDPNWGRIVSAAGYASVDFDVNQVGLKINGHEIFAAGQPLKFDAKTVSRSISEHFETVFDLTFGEGDAGVTFWTSDLTVDYVNFNAEYHT